MNYFESEEDIQKRIDEYTNKYCEKHHISKEEAEQHIMIKNMADYYKKGSNR